MYRGGCAFIERLEEGGQPIDPVHSWHIKRESVQSKIIIEDKPKESSTVWKPYKDNDITF
jgi:hypothetical protein